MACTAADPEIPEIGVLIGVFSSKWIVLKVNGRASSLDEKWAYTDWISVPKLPNSM
jgi:hypothetical protein